MELRGRELVERIAVRADRPPRARPSCSGRGSAASPRRRSPSGPGSEAQRPGPRDEPAERHARGRVDRDRLAGDDGRRDPQRPRRRPGADRGARGGGRMSVADRDAPRRRDRRARPTRLLELQHAGRLLGRRARVERDHDRAAPLLAPRPRPAHARARPQDRQRAAGAAARRRHLVDLVRGPGRPLDDGRGLRGAEARRRRPGPAGARLHPLARAGSRRRGSSPSASSPCSASGPGSG